MGIEKITNNISRKMGDRLNKNQEEVAVLNYGLFIVIHTSIAIILTFAIGLVTNMTLEIMIISVVAALLKRYSGGVHSSTPSRCIITGIIFALLLSIICKSVLVKLNYNVLGIVIAILLIYSYYVLYKNCPVPCENKPLKKESTRKRLRKNAFKLVNIYTALIIVFYLLNIYKNLLIFKISICAMLLGILLQIFSLTKTAKLTINGFEKLYDFFRI